MNGGDYRRRDRKDTRISKKQKLILNAEEQLESKLGFNLFTEGDKRLGWLLTFASSSWEDQETRKVYSCVDLYFVCQDGSTFKAKYRFRPYFFAATKDKMEMDVEAYLKRRYEGQIADIEIVEKEDLDLKNHLSGLHKCYLKISFDTVQQLIQVKNDLIHVVERNKAKLVAEDAYESILTGKSKQRPQDSMDCIIDLREYDVPYHVRFAIDNDVRCGQWFDVSVSCAGVAMERRSDLLQRAEVHVCAFDIETTKLPLKFPDAEYDSIMMISYMVDGQGYLIINREVNGTEDDYVALKNHCYLIELFRDRRYEYKGLNKVWKGKLSEAKASGNSIKIQEAQDMVVVYDSLQLAHKCILNSFYGYVMRKGARWYSMEMAGVVTYTGAKIIQNARLLVERIGRPLELDTDGIWCALPGSFPENYTFKSEDSKKLTISYPCVMLNVDVARNNTNDQYQTLQDSSRKTYTTHSECSIEFEIDGPYKAMILPASKEEGILIKKRYAVFNDDGTLAELKGFEIKRRGELKLIKVFQAELFDKFLHGETLEECYSVVASVANRWLDLLDNQGKDIADSELLDFISESSTMSKSLADYGEQKSCAVTTAKRLADFLGDAMVKDKGLRCQYIVAREPKGTPVSERAVPVAIFETEAEIMKFYVKKWCKVSSEVGIRSIIDWSYYKQRLSSAIQKIITIPAAMQKVANPVPRVVHPDWLHKKVREKEEKFRQRKLIDIFSSQKRDEAVRTNNDPFADKSNDVKDMEDFRKAEKTPLVGPQPIVCTYGVNHTPHQVKTGQPVESSRLHDRIESVHMHLKQLFQNDLEENIDSNEDYLGWLELRKRKWREIREKRKRQRLNLVNGTDMLSIPNHERTQGRVRVNSYFRRHDLALTRCHWQIIQLAAGSQPGQFFAWVVVEGTMHKIPIFVPRVFYLNSKAPVTEQFPGRRVNKILPHGRRSHNLIEVKIDEDQFRVESKKLAAHLADPEVEGVYEMKIPLEFNAILQIGCVCKVDKTAKKRNFQDGWSVDELHMKTTAECPYLEQSISFFYLYHSISDGRAMFVGYFPVSSQIFVVVASPFLSKELSTQMLERQFRESTQASSFQPPMPNERITFKVDYTDNVKDAQMTLQRIITEYRQRHHGPVIAVVECPNIQLLKSGLRALEDFPCVTIPANLRDSQYQAIGWQVLAAKNGILRCASSSQWLNARVSLSRYAHVPLGNFESDWLIHTADIFLSRALHDQQQVLWISDNGIPDLGGIDEEVPCFIDEVTQPVLTYPGAYRKVTVELKIHHLAVNALLKSNQVNEMEGGALFGLEKELNPPPSTSDERYSFDEAISCAPAFRVLKQLIQRCLADVVSSRNVFADTILQHLYRWLCSPKSKLHDPAIHHMLHKVMQKIFALLMAELRKFGATIVFASFTKVIVDTGKSDISAAKAYCESVLKTLQTRDLFEWIELEPFKFWHSLLFMDQYNYGGIQARLKDDSTEEFSGASIESMLNNSQVDIVSSWTIAENLPKSTQDHFILIVSEFLYFPWKYTLEESEKRASAVGNLCTPSITASTAEILESQMTEFLKIKIRSHFTEKLLKIVSDPSLHMDGRNKSRSDHNTLTGSLQSINSSYKGDPALDFIKYVCAVLALDQKVQHEVLIMRRNLLKLVSIREFAPEAEFHYLSLSLTLPNVICSYCNDCRDLDLCRDRTLTSQEWCCAAPQCGQPYDREVLENSLLQILRQRERLYHLQDLVCLKCSHVKAAHLAEYCTCGGSFTCKEESSEFHRKMQVFWNVAIDQKFQLLQECISWILEVR
ncbi:DNA polymerase epsilon catalytic subunit A-like [Primulina huaijiensis]|uniref:DNA polymerase epsilon catalytic subunit A-like n=1 Tax=Primulina huaijiensis TaxID=1492673 RepID=UPI003CC79723